MSERTAYGRRRPSAGYAAALASLAAFQDAPRGRAQRAAAVVSSLPLIVELFRRHSVQTALHYGAGTGDLHGLKPIVLSATETRPSLDVALGAEFRLYDPTVPAHLHMPPGKFDAVLACDFLDFLPWEDRDWALREMFYRAQKCLFIGCTGFIEEWLPLLKKLTRRWDIDWLLSLRRGPGVTYLYRRGARRNCEFVRPLPAG